MAVILPAMALQQKALTGTPESDVKDGVMVALFPDADTAAKLALDGGAAADDLHITVAYLGKTDQVDAEALRTAAETVAARSPITGKIAGIGRFTGGDRGDVLVALYDSAGLEQLRRDLDDALATAGLQRPREHGYTPHLTLGYLDAGDDSPITRIEPVELNFEEMVVAHGGERTSVPLTGPPQQGAPPPSKASTPQDGQQLPTQTKAAPPVCPGAFVLFGQRAGQVDLVVQSGTVPAAGHADTGDPVTGTKAAPAARVIELAPAGDGTWQPTGAKFAVTASALTRTAALRTRETKSLTEALAWARSGHGDPGLASLYSPPPLDTLRQVYDRGVKSWPGSQVTTLSERSWALSRVDAFVATAAGVRPAGYFGDDDLLTARR